MKNWNATVDRHKIEWCNHIFWSATKLAWKFSLIQLFTWKDVRIPYMLAQVLHPSTLGAHPFALVIFEMFWSEMRLLLPTYFLLLAFHESKLWKKIFPTKRVVNIIFMFLGWKACYLFYYESALDQEGIACICLLLWQLTQNCPPIPS